jgi:hypothetical protein
MDVGTLVQGGGQGVEQGLCELIPCGSIGTTILICNFDLIAKIKIHTNCLKKWDP